MLIELPRLHFFLFPFSLHIIFMLLIDLIPRLST